jgi:hypothetical protein
MLVILIFGGVFFKIYFFFLTAISFYYTLLAPGSVTSPYIFFFKRTNTKLPFNQQRTQVCQEKKNLFLSVFLPTKFSSSDKKNNLTFLRVFGMYLNIISTYSPSSDVASLGLNYRWSSALLSSFPHYKEF